MQGGTLVRFGVIATLFAAPASAGATVDLAHAPAGIQRIDGQATSDLVGQAVANVGDVNGDGKADFAVGAAFADNNGRSASGSAYVIYGGQSASTIDLQSLGASGFRIDGAASLDFAGLPVAGARDFNGDGIADVLMTAPQAGNNSRATSGSAYVIYGQNTADPADVDLANITTSQAARGMRIDGAAAGDNAGVYADGVGDVNGDGLDDIAMGAKSDNNGRTDSGSVYIVYGQQTSDPADLDLNTITSTNASRGMRIDGAAASDGAFATSGAGDTNGDGSGDVIVGASGADNNGRNASGSSYVIFGQQAADPADVDLNNITGSQAGRGMRIDGAATSDFSGEPARAGDVNGDGIADVLIGASSADNNGRNGSGSAYIVYGQQTTDPADVDLANITTSQGARGVRIDGAGPNDSAGSKIAGGQDLNGDGTDDVVVATPQASFNGAGSGSVYAVFGQHAADPSDVDLNQITGTQADRGIRVDGAAPGDALGASVAAAGDVNGDGHADMILGASGADNNGRTSSGSVYVVDIAAPVTTLDQAPTLTSDSTPTFTFHGSETGSFQCSIDLGVGGFAPCSGPGGTHTPATPLPDGTFTFRVFAVDASGNADPTPVTQQFTVDTTGPDTSVDSGPTLTNDPTPTFAFSSEEAGATFRCSIDQGTASLQPCSGPGATHTPAAPLGDGTYTFRAAASDSLGNVDPRPATQRFTVDTTAPDTAIDSGPTLSNDPTPTFTFSSGEPGATFQCSIDQGSASLAACTGPGTADTPASPLADGTYTFRAAAGDAAGNADTSPATQRFTVDTRPPETTIVKPPAKVVRLKNGHATASVKFSFEASEGSATFECNLDTTPAKTCTSPKSFKLRKGKHRFSVTATDPTGNVDASAANRSVTVKPPKRHRHRR